MGKVSPSAGRSRASKAYAGARARGRRERAEGLHAERARFDSAEKRVVLELVTGYSFGIPLARLPEVSGATNAELSEVEVIGAGTILHWESLDADYSIPALILAVVGTTDIARQFGRAGGKATSGVKAEAARLNGAKGGRPRLAAGKK